MDIQEARAHWKTLNEVWKTANQNARMSRHQVTKKFGECVAGNGPGPSEALIEETRRLEAIADHAKMEEEALLRNYFG